MTRRVVACVIGVGLVVLSSTALVALRTTRPVPMVGVSSALIPRVETLTITPVVFESPIIGYGTVRPKRQVKIVPEVGGRLTQVHDDLAVGNVIPKGELLFEIDPRVYDAKVQQVRSEIARLEAQLRRHEQEKSSLEKRLSLAEQMASLSKSAVSRESGLMEQRSGTAPELERAEERHLTNQDVVLGYRSQLELIPLQVEETGALLETKRSQLDEALLNVEKTRIYCPFDARVDAVTAQISQVVITSFHIATLTDMEALELPVVIDPRDLRWTDQDAFASAIGDDLESAPTARVTWTLYGHEFATPARVTRLERMDEVTRTAHVVVEIRDIMRSLESSTGHSRPPFSVGMFCRAELPTEPLPDALVVPRHALRDGESVYVFVPDASDPRYGRLDLKRVAILRSVGDDVVVSYRGAERADAAGDSELLPGDEVVVSALPKAVEGMRLERKPSVEAVAMGAAADVNPQFAIRNPQFLLTPHFSPLASFVVLGSVTGGR